MFKKLFRNGKSIATVILVIILFSMIIYLFFTLYTIFKEVENLNKKEEEIRKTMKSGDTVYIQGADYDASVIDSIERDNVYYHSVTKKHQVWYESPYRDGSTGWSANKK